MLCGWKPLSNGTLMPVFGGICAWDRRAFGVYQMQACSWKDLRAVLAKHCCVASSGELVPLSLALDVGRTSSDLPARNHTNTDRFVMFTTETVIKKWHLELTSVVTTARDLITVHLETSCLKDECFPQPRLRFSPIAQWQASQCLAPFAVISMPFFWSAFQAVKFWWILCFMQIHIDCIWLFLRHLLSNVCKSLPIPGVYKTEN